MIEGNPERRPRIEGDPEIQRLKRAIETVVVSGSGKAELESLLRMEPQRDSSGNLRYLVTSGMAVELVTGFQRPHKDLDLVIMDPNNTDYWEVYGTDNVIPQMYWANMEFDPHFLDTTSVRTMTRPKGMKVEVVHPAILLVQKCSNAFGRPPREKDLMDVLAINGYWKNKLKYTRKWNPIVSNSLDALPREETQITLARVREVLKLNK